MFALVSQVLVRKRDLVLLVILLPLNAISFVVVEAGEFTLGGRNFDLHRCLETFDLRLDLEIIVVGVDDLDQVGLSVVQVTSDHLVDVVAELVVGDGNGMCRLTVSVEL